jgi:hypothetical protein
MMQHPTDMDIDVTDGLTFYEWVNVPHPSFYGRHPASAVPCFGQHHAPTRKRTASGQPGRKRLSSPNKRMCSEPTCGPRFAIADSCSAYECDLYLPIESERTSPPPPQSFSFFHFFFHFFHFLFFILFSSPLGRT